MKINSVMPQTSNFKSKNQTSFGMSLKVDPSLDRISESRAMTVKRALEDSSIQKIIEKRDVVFSHLCGLSQKVEGGSLFSDHLEITMFNKGVKNNMLTRMFSGKQMSDNVNIIENYPQKIIQKMKEMDAVLEKEEGPSSTDIIRSYKKK